MIDKELIEKLRQLKAQRGYTLYELSKKIDIQLATLERVFNNGGARNIK